MMTGDGRRHRGRQRRVTVRHGVERLGQPEVQHLHGAVRPDFDVRRLEIPMDDTRLVRRLQRLRDLRRNRQRVFD
jgi:hypothetical protein